MDDPDEDKIMSVKRTSPDSFPTPNSDPKRPRTSDNPDTSNLNINQDTCNYADSSGSVSREDSDDENSQDDHEEDDFIVTRSVRTELEKELGVLNAVVPLDESQSESHENELSDVDEALQNVEVGDIPVSTADHDQLRPEVRASSEKSNDLSEYKNVSKRKKIGFYNPLLWEEGSQDKEALANSKFAPEIICGTTKVLLHTSHLAVTGTAWNEALSVFLPKFLTVPGFTPLPSEKESHEFLKACYRLGNAMHPERLSRLLGGHYRSSTYCHFFLDAMLGLFNNPRVRALLGIKSSGKKERRDKPLFVYADSIYASDDEFLQPEDQPLEDASDVQAEEGGVTPTNGATVVLMSDNNINEPDVFQRTLDTSTHQLQLTDPFAELFANTPSYVLRNFISNIAGSPQASLEDFLQHCSRNGVPFAENCDEHPDGRLKWLKMRTLAPEIGENKAVLGVLPLWKHALKCFSLKNLTRCSLIRTDRLLDWLGFVACEKATPKTEEEFYRMKRPVVAIAPIPLLFLADKASNFVLQVLDVVIHFVTTTPLEDETIEENPTIDEGDIFYAIRQVLEDYYSVVALQIFSEHPWMAEEKLLGNFGNWPLLKKRPMTESECVTLCDRMPANSFRVPVNTTEEMKAVVMSFSTHKAIRQKLYLRPGEFKSTGPFFDMTEKAKKNVKSKDDGCEEMKHVHSHDTTIRKSLCSVEASESPSGDNRDPAKRKGEAMLLEKCQDKMDPMCSSSNSVVKEDQNMSKSDSGPEDVPKSVTGTGINLSDFFKEDRVANNLSNELGFREKGKPRTSKHRTKMEKRELQKKIRESLDLFLKASLEEPTLPSLSVCPYRISWLLNHALGVPSVEPLDADNPMTYGTTVNYTNFRKYGQEIKVYFEREAFIMLCQFTEALVRHEAEILMACAENDDGRPWIDRLDVMLLTSIRKEEYRYKDI